MLILVATDAAGEGINLQRAHLMVNYDLPWNPNRLEQRFGRIHRIGQTEVCHLWNLVAGETREGDVYQRLLDEDRAGAQAPWRPGLRRAGPGALRRASSLRDLLIEAIRYGDRPGCARTADAGRRGGPGHASDSQELIEEQALARDTMDSPAVQAVRERDGARRGPHACSRTTSRPSSWKPSATGRTHPRARAATLRDHPRAGRHPQPDRQIGVGEPVLRRYERVSFEKHSISLPRQAGGRFICPGHPLLDAVIDVTSERNRGPAQARRDARR